MEDNKVEINENNKQSVLEGHPVVYMFTAPARSGKDTCGMMVKKTYESMGKRVLWINYADFVKVICARNFDYDESNKEQGRHILQEFGTDIARAKSPTIWIDTVFHLFDTVRFNYDAFIVSDARFENELKPYPYIFTYPIVNIFVERESKEEIGKDEKQHSSEAFSNNPDMDRFDYVVDNNGTLEETATQIANIVLEIEEHRQEILDEQRGLGNKSLDELENFLDVEGEF